MSNLRFLLIIADFESPLFPRQRPFAWFRGIFASNFMSHSNLYKWFIIFLFKRIGLRRPRNCKPLCRKFSRTHCKTFRVTERPAEHRTWVSSVTLIEALDSRVSVQRICLIKGERGEDRSPWSGVHPWMQWIPCVQILKFRSSLQNGRAEYDSDFRNPKISIFRRRMCCYQHLQEA